MLQDLCKQIGFEPVLLQANDKQGTKEVQNMLKSSLDEPLLTAPGRPIYHTNVFMSIMTSLAVICMEAIQGEEARAVIEVMIGLITKTRSL